MMRPFRLEGLVNWKLDESKRNFLHNCCSEAYIKTTHTKTAVRLCDSLPKGRILPNLHVHRHNSSWHAHYAGCNLCTGRRESMLCPMFFVSRQGLCDLLDRLI